MRATKIRLATGKDRDVSYEDGDEDCPKCESGCEQCVNGIIPWEWHIDWDSLASSY